MSDTFPVTIYHNPDCGTSRNALAMIEAAGYTPAIIDYRAVGWSRAQLAALLEAMALRARDLLRERGTRAAELGLTDPEVADETVLEAMLLDPLLVNRPIVVTSKGVRLCRPSEIVLTLLKQTPESFIKEDGEAVRP